MPKKKSAIRCIIRNMKNKKEDANRKKKIKQMGYDAAEPRAPAASAAKVRRKLKKKRDALKEQSEEPPQKDYASPKKAAAMKRQLEVSNKSTEKAVRSGRGGVTNRGDVKVVSVLGIDADCVPFPEYWLLWDNKERDIQHRVRTLLTNLAKASREKALPAASTLDWGKTNKKEKRHVPTFKNVGSDIVKVCLSQPVWALVHRRDLKRGFDEWFENNDNLVRLLNNGDADNINAAMKTAVTNQINDAVKERVYFEMLGNVCNDLFKTLVLPNKKFDKNFATIATDNTNPTVRSLSIPKYFRALNENVWQKITDSMDILLTGGGSGDQSAISQLEACAENIINRAISRPVEATIKKAVEQANQAYKLSTGAFTPIIRNKKTAQGQLQGSPFFNPGYYDPYYHYYYQQQPPPFAHCYYYYGPGGAPPAVTQMYPPPHLYQHPPPTSDTVPPTAAAQPSDVVPLTAAAPTPRASTAIATSPVPSPVKSAISSPVRPSYTRYVPPSPQIYSPVLQPVRPPRTPGRDLDLGNRESRYEEISEMEEEISTTVRTSGRGLENRESQYEEISETEDVIPTTVRTPGRDLENREPRSLYEEISEVGSEEEMPTTSFMKLPAENYYHLNHEPSSDDEIEEDGGEYFDDDFI